MVTDAILAGGIGYWWLPPNEPNGKPADNSGGSTYRSDILQKLIEEQRQALSLMHSDKPEAIRLVDDNLGGITQALRSFPNDADLHALAGDAAKNVYASSKGVLPPDKRAEYLARAQRSFEQALKLDPNDAGAVNGTGNVLFYEGRFDEAIRRFEEAIKLAGGEYEDAAHDLNLARRVKAGEIAFDP